LAPADAQTSAAAVEMFTGSKLPPPVPTTSSTSPSSARGTALARMTRTMPAISSTVSPFMRSAVNSAAIWEGVAASVMISSIVAAASASERSRPATTVAIASRMVICRVP
jgi:hypothetical protein